MRQYPRLLRAPKGSFFLLGPRGTGKTAWVAEHFSDAHEIDLLDEGKYQSLLADPALFAAELRALPAGARVAVDEIQRLPGLLNEVHRAIEKLRLQFVLTGSSARKLKSAGTNLLAGRALVRHMHPFLAAELGSDFQLERVLRFGSIPLVWAADEPAEHLKAYVQTYLREEIKAEALVRNLAGFARFLPIAALFHAQVINVSNVARDAGVGRTTVAGFFDILEDTLVAFRLPAYTAKLRVRERQHPKFYLYDPGVVRALKGQLGEVTREERGALFEGWLINAFRAHNDYTPFFTHMSYWAATESEIEVDLLLEHERKFMAFEFKATKRLRPEHFRGLEAIAGLPGLKQRVLVYEGDTVLQTDAGIQVWPVGHLLQWLSAPA